MRFRAPFDIQRAPIARNLPRGSNLRFTLARVDHAAFEPRRQFSSHLCERLHERGHDVVGLDCFTDYYPRVLKDLNAADVEAAGVPILRLDLASDDLAEPVAGAEAIYHAAAQPGNSAATPFEAYVRNNITATHRLVEAARVESSLRLFVNVATSSVCSKSGWTPSHGRSPRSRPSCPRSQASYPPRTSSPHAGAPGGLARLPIRKARRDRYGYGAGAIPAHDLARSPPRDEPGGQFPVLDSARLQERNRCASLRTTMTDSRPWSAT